MGYLNKHDILLVLSDGIVVTDSTYSIFVICLNSFPRLSVLKRISPSLPLPSPVPLANFYYKHDYPGECRKGSDSVICQIAALDGDRIAVLNQRIGRNELAQRMR